MGLPIDPIPSFEFELWPKSSKAIVSSVLIAVAFTACAQVAERVDTALTGGSVLIFGNINLFTWLVIGCCLFGMTGALIVANINPIVANLTATGPLAPIWFIENTINGIIIVAVLRLFGVGEKEITFEKFLIAGLAGFPGLFPELFAIILIWGGTIDFFLIACVIIFISVGIGTAIGFFITRSIVRSEVLWR
ncbi:MAG: hypothetical protein EAX86_04040 [Candidatus Heimdallarchaeota archaeon]|nr:hypothetical protein [Candidatus Heimdallarchaeota archaeon]